MDKEIKEKAHNKVYAIYLNLMRESLQPDKYWKIDPDRAIELEKLHEKDVQVYSYILSLIEKDNQT
jgi:coenzyme F420-reducing hydrogenase beta subunit